MSKAQVETILAANDCRDKRYDHFQENDYRLRTEEIAIATFKTMRLMQRH
jgi:hypothetical protein